MSMIERAGGQVFFEAHGDGEPVVILRGLGRSVRHWLGYEQQLAKIARVVVMDLRGIGRTTTPWSWRTRIEDVAGDVVAVLDALKIPAAHILGVSLGGMVSLATGLEHAKRCKSLIVINSSIAGLRIPRLTLDATRALVDTAISRGDLHMSLVEALVGPDCEAARQREIAEKYARISAEEGLSAATVVRQLAAAARFNVVSALPKLAVKSLVVYGTNDRFVPTLNSRKIATRIPGAHLAPLSRAGHEPTLDKSAELTALIHDWIKTSDRR